MTQPMTDTSAQPDLLADFERNLRASGDAAGAIYAGLIGKNAMVPGPNGPQKLVYADYVASGRAIRQIEDFMVDEVLPYYANSHTEASFTGGFMTRLRENARHIIAAKCGGNEQDHAVVFTGSGATAGLNRLVHLFGIREALENGKTPYVLVGPYEHHSNLLPWRESGATVIEIPEATDGGPDLDELQKVLAEVAPKGPVIGAFSAASNVTGVCTDVVPVTRMVKAVGGKIVWDYAGGGPYLTIEMNPAEGLEIDAIALSPHKYIGGPGASGVLILRRDTVVTHTPSYPGGGTVAFVNGSVHDYSDRIEDREEGGTPNITGDIRAGLVMIVKDVIGQDFITKRNADLTAKAMAALKNHPNIDLLARNREQRLPIFSFIVRDNAGNMVDYQLYTRMLSDLYGIQARGGCACAGPYVHHLLHIDDQWSNQIRCEILAGDEGSKPGFIRLNFSYLMDEATVDFILKSVMELAASAADLAQDYPATASSAQGHGHLGRSAP